MSMLLIPIDRITRQVMLFCPCIKEAECISNYEFYAELKIMYIHISRSGSWVELYDLSKDHSYYMQLYRFNKILKHKLLIQSDLEFSTQNNGSDVYISGTWTFSRKGQYTTIIPVVK